MQIFAHQSVFGKAAKENDTLSRYCVKQRTRTWLHDNTNGSKNAQHPLEAEAKKIYLI